MAKFRVTYEFLIDAVDKEDAIEIVERKLADGDVCASDWFYQVEENDEGDE